MTFIVIINIPFFYVSRPEILKHCSMVRSQAGSQKQLENLKLWIPGAYPKPELEHFFLISKVIVIEYFRITVFWKAFVLKDDSI